MRAALVVVDYTDAVELVPVVAVSVVAAASAFVEE